MHRVLIIRELQRQIFDCFLPDFDVETVACAWTESFQNFIPDREARGTLLNLALTCRAFEDSALDALWWAMEDLTPLFAMLKSYREVGNTKLLRGAIPTLEVEKFFSYAARVKLFYFRGPTSISSTAYMRILLAGRRHHLLPSLKYLLCDQSLLDLFIFASPTLLVVNISNECEEGEQLPDEIYVRALIESLTNISPGLIGLRMSYEMTSDCLEAVLSLSNLKYLHLDNSLPVHCPERLAVQLLDYQYMRRLSSLSRLLRLDIFWNIHLLPGNRLGAQVLTFWTLRKIDLRISPLGYVADLISLFRAAAFPALECFEAFPCSHDREALVDEFKDFLTALNDATTPGTFCSLGLFTDWHPEIHAEVSVRQCITALRRLGLTAFKVSFFQDLLVRDIRTLSAVWPNLQELRLDSLNGLTFDFLIGIAQHFSNLRDLKLDVDLRVLPKPDDVPIVVEHPLARLALHPRDEAPLQNPFDFAVSLAKLFPDLRRLPVPFWNEEFRRHWEEMVSILGIVQFARKEQELAELLGIVLPSDPLRSQNLNRERIECLASSELASKPPVSPSTPE